MSIQRWTKIFTRYPASKVLPNENGEYVTYADHVAALAEAEQRGWNAGFDRSNEMAREDALDAAREALELLPVSLIDDRFGPADERRYVLAVRLTTALAAIDALTEGEQT